MFKRWLLPFGLFFLFCTTIVAQETPSPKVVITIKPTDDPMQIDALKPLLNKDVGRFWGDSAWKPPADDPAKITKADYLAALKPDLDFCVNYYGKPQVTPEQYAYEAMPTFAVYFKATGDGKYADLLLLAIKKFCSFLDEDLAKQNAEMAKTGAKAPGAGSYWFAAQYTQVMEGLWALEGTPQYPQARALLAKSIGDRADAWPIYFERIGASNRPITSAFGYDVALWLRPNLAQAKEMRDYADKVWNDWWARRDLDEDCAHYTGDLDLPVMNVWARVRGVDIWKDPVAPNLWKCYAEQAGMDGTWLPYGDGGVQGDYFTGLLVLETTATGTRDGRYKWLAHRMFWNGRDRISKLVNGIGYWKYVQLAEAYLHADDTVKEIPVQAGITLTKRRFRERTNWSHITGNDLFFILHDEWQPNKLIFRAGSKETDQYMMLQAGNQAGHGHPDSGNLSQYGGDFAYYLAYGVSRLDDDMEQHNLFTLRDPVKDKPWKAQFSSEETSVPVMGQASDASYARLHIQEYPGFPVSPENWQRVYGWNGGGYPPEKAVGYKNWPVRLDRCVLFINNQFSVVRDVMTASLPVKAQIGQNWTFGELGPTIGTHWVNVWIPKMYGFVYSQPPRAPVELAQRDLLIWFVPQKDAVMQVVDGPTGSWYGNYYINLSRRAWYPRTGDWQPGQPQAFTTLLLPHLPSTEPEKLAATISTVLDTPEATILKVTDGETVRIIFLNTSGKPVTAASLTTDAEAALLTLVKGKPAHLSAWHATTVLLGKKKLLASPMAKDLDVTLK